MTKSATKKINKIKKIKIVLIQVSCASESEAERIGVALVRERLAACVNVVPSVSSIYRWHEGVEEASEALLVAKTTAGKASAAAARIKALHSYDLPSIEFVEARVDEGVAAWISKSVK